MMQVDFQRFNRLAALDRLDRPFRFVVHPLDTAVHNGSTSVEPIRKYLAQGPAAFQTFQ